MYANEGIFSSLNKIFSHTVKLGINTSMKLTVKVVVKLILHGVCYTISKVYSVSKPKNNLLSTRQLQEKRVAI